MSIVADLAQTFFIDRNAVKKAETIYVTSVDLYFFNKPTPGNTSSNLPEPGCTVYICPTLTVNGEQVPDLREHVEYGRSRVSYADINVDTDEVNEILGDETTRFSFTHPVPISTAESYAVVIKFDGADSGFSLWRNKAGEIFNSVQSPASTSGALDGKFYVLTNGTAPQPQAGVDLRMKINIGKFTTTPTTYKAFNRNFEQIILGPLEAQGAFIGGEYVYGNTGPVPGAQTISVSTTSKIVTGTGTQFQSQYTNGQYMVIKSGTTSAVRKITSITNNTRMSLEFEPPFTNTSAEYVLGPIAKVVRHDQYQNVLFLTGSTANSTVKFEANTTQNFVVGVSSNAVHRIAGTIRAIADRFTPDFQYFKPAGTDITQTAKLSTLSTFTTDANSVVVTNKQENYISGAAKSLHSRSDEITNGTGAVGVLENGKSMNFDFTLSTTNEFTSPMIDEEDLNVTMSKFILNNSAQNEFKPSGGDSASKFISRRIKLAEEQAAEDFRFYATCYRPRFTNIRPYIKAYNSADPEPMSDKDYSYCEPVISEQLFSSPSNTKDYIELEWHIPRFPIDTTFDPFGSIHSGPVVNATATGVDGSNVIQLTADVSSSGTGELANNDLVRIYDRLFPNNSLVAVALIVTGSSITIDTTLDSTQPKLNDFIGSGLIVEKCARPHQAYRNYINDDVVRYYNTEMTPFDTFDTFTYKLLLLGTQGSGQAPFVEDCRGIALSI